MDQQGLKTKINPTESKTEIYVAAQGNEKSKLSLCNK